MYLYILAHVLTSHPYAVVICALTFRVLCIAGKKKNQLSSNAHEKKNYVAALIKMFKESLQTIKLIILNQL